MTTLLLEKPAIEAMPVTLSSFTPSFVQKLARKVEDRLETRFQDWGNFMNDDSIRIDEQVEFDSVMTDICEDEDIPEAQCETLNDLVWEALDHSLWDTARNSIQECYEDAHEYTHHPLRYHGLTMHDFL